MQKEMALLSELYPEKDLERQKKRYLAAIEGFRHQFGEIGSFRIFSAPGRTEVGGNHTDHNCGKVLAAGVNLDVIAIVEPTNDNIITIKSEGYAVDSVDLNYLEPEEAEKNTSAALIRGVAGGFAKNSYQIGGFRAYTTSDVLKGSGLSSSAAFEVLIGTILSSLYNDKKIGSIKIAQIAQYAENVYFGKPSGLMDQTASSVGGFVAIDFKDPKNPVVENINVDFGAFSHALCIVDTKGDHADLTHEYAAIPEEMRQIANFFSADCLRSLARQDIILNINKLREKYGDRPILRSLHFFEENERVDKLVHALKAKDFQAFLYSIRESGNSSYKYLQNIFAVSDVTHQALGIGLNIAEHSLHRKGACRVHGGGFAGTIQAFVPIEQLKEFRLDMENCFGAGSCHILSIRPVGGTEISL